jgi:hypothetical protein
LPCEFALPAWHENIIETYFDGKVSFRKYEKSPKAGFCGYGATTEQTLLRKLKLFTKSLTSSIGIYIPYTDGIWYRKRAIERLSKHLEVETSFV